MPAHSKQPSKRRRLRGASRKAALPPLIKALLEPGLYPHPVEAVELIETHISYLLLAGDYAYKIKKPVNLGFLDFSTLAARRHYCEEELRLNRRTAPALYLGVVAVTGGETAPVMAGTGTTIEYAVKMRRFPQEALLDHLARNGALQPEHVDALAGTLARFHAVIDRAGGDNKAGCAQSVLDPALQNFDQIRELLDHGPAVAALDALRTWTEDAHARLADCFESRWREGFIRECHGDLHLGNVALIDGVPTPFDGIEFNAAFRWIDVMNETAFMVMDLLDHGLSRFAFRFLSDYLELTGDYAGLRVLRFYLVYRAMVRAKVALIRARQSAGGDVEAAELQRLAEQDFVHHIALAAALTATAKPALILMHGVSGSGKSTVAGVLLERLGAVRLRSDVERKRLHGLAATARTGAGLESAIYTADDTERAYRRLAELAQAGMQAGFPMIVDATFLKRWQRDQFRHLAANAGAPFAIVSCMAPEGVLRQRVTRREQENADASEAGLAVLDHQGKILDALADDELAQTIAMDTGDDGHSFDPPITQLAQRLGLKAAPA